MSRLARFGNRLVIIFRRKQESRRKDAGSIEQHNNPADGAENPRLVQRPTDEEAVVVVV